MRDTRKQFEAFKSILMRPLRTRKNANCSRTSPCSNFSTRRRPLPNGGDTDAKAEDPKAFAEWQEYEQTELPNAGQVQKIIDFHRIVAAMNQYPTLLRRLGLAIDLLIPRDAFHCRSPTRCFGRGKLPRRTTERLAGHVAAARARS